MDNDISLLRRCIEDRSPILLLGAGFSLGAKGRNGQKLMLGGALAQRLYEEITQSANKYVFGAVPLLQISLTEKVNSVLANSMYEKLNEKYLSTLFVHLV